MKKLLLFIGLAVIGFTFQPSANAQTRVNVNINIGSQPIWGPTGYDYAEYYYLPDIDVYYYVPQRQFIYLQGNRWMRSNSLPPAYRNFDLYHSYKVVINEENPYMHDNIYRSRYARYKGRRDQLVIRDSHETKYFQIAEHPEHNKWQANRKNDYSRRNDRDNRRDNRDNDRRH